MKTDTLVILAAAGAALYAVSRMTKPRPSGGGGASSLNMGGQVSIPGTVANIFNPALPGQPGWGWDYYSDGTSIGPDGSYYLNGKKIWSPT